MLRVLLGEAALELNAGKDDLALQDGQIVVCDDPSRSMSFGEPASRLPTDCVSVTASRSDDYSGFRRRMPGAALAHEDLGGVQFAEVAVDTETGVVRVERVVAVQDCGRSINPLQVESQVHGGVLMGLSFALYEIRILHLRTGRMVNPNLELYNLAADNSLVRIGDALGLKLSRASRATALLLRSQHHPRSDSRSFQ